MAGCLHVVATPIGNLNDVSCRAAKVLAEVETIAAEDTRRTATLLRHLGVAARRLLPLHDHNEGQAAPRLVERLRAGESVALVTDAGLPLIADPGFELVRRCWEAGVKVVPVPGASAVTALLSVCPLPADRVQFVGFPPSRRGARERELQRLCRASAAALFFEAPHRMEATLAAVASLAPQRRLFVGREMTKKYEAYYCGSAAEVLDELRSGNAVKGEFACLLESLRSEAAAPELDAHLLLRALVNELPPSGAARVMAQVFGGKKADYYSQAAAIAHEATVPGDV